MRERNGQLLIALLAMFLIYPLAVETGLNRWFGLVMVAVLAASAYAVSGRRRVLLVALALGVPAILAQLVNVALPGRSALLVAASLTFLFLAFVTVVIFAAVLAPGRVTKDRLVGAVCVYLLLGMAWAMLFMVVSVVQPGAFVVREEAMIVMGEGAEYSFIYFSFVCLTTLGFGDITPTAPLSQTLVWLEAAAGQLYLAILVARLVGLHIAHREVEE